MSQFEQIKISGYFQDNITPVIKRINKEMRSLQDSTMALSGGRAKRRSFAFFTEATGAIAGMSTELDKTTQSLAAYRRQALGVARANARIARSNATGGGGAGNGGRSSGGGDGGGDGGYAPSFMKMAGASALGNVVSNAITSAFTYGAGLIQKSVSHIMQGISERIQDQESDIKSAGGIFSLAQRKGLKDFGGTFDAAMQFQKGLNAELAKVASALPGNTSEYVQTSKGLTDGLMTTIGKDAVNFQKTFGGGSTDMKEAMKSALTDLTTKGVLLGQGQQGGIPLPVLLEQVLSQDKVNVQSLKTKFVALRDNPLLSGALEEAEKEINATGANTAKRLELVLQTLDKALPAEQINALKRSTGGIIESFRSFILDPDAGLFGLGRSLNFQIKEFSSTTGLATGAMMDTGLFDMMNEIFANIAVVFAEGLPILAQVFDPLSKMGSLFTTLREQSYKLFAVFNKLTVFYKQTAEKLGVGADNFEVGVRSFIGSFTIWLEGMGAFTKGEADNILGVLKGQKTLTKEFKADALSKIWKKFMGSSFMLDLGANFGKGLATLIKEINTGFKVLSGAATGATGPLTAALSAFADAGGGAAFRELITSVVGAVLNFAKEQLLLFVKENPFSSATALGTAYVAMNPQVLSPLMEKIGGAMMTAITPALTSFSASALGTGLTALAPQIAAFLGGPVVWVGIAAVLLTAFRDPILNFLRGIGIKFQTWAASQTGVWGMAMRYLSESFNKLVNMLSGVLRFLNGIWLFVSGLLTGDWQKTWDGIKEMMGGFGDTLWTMIEGLTNAVLAPFQWVGERLGLLDRDTRRRTRLAERRFSRNHSSLLGGMAPSTTGGSSSGGASTSGGGGASTSGGGGGGSFSGGSTSGAVTKYTGGAVGGDIMSQFKAAPSSIVGKNISLGGSITEKMASTMSEEQKQKFANVMGLAESLGLYVTSAKRDTSSFHGWRKGQAHALDFQSKGGSSEKYQENMAKFAAGVYSMYGGGGIQELFYSFGPVQMSGGKVRGFGEAGVQWLRSAGLEGPGQKANHRHHVHVALAGGHTSPLLQEARNMPAGARLAVANTSEAVLNRDQMKGMFEGLSSGGRGGVNIGTINVSGNNAQDLARQVVDEIERQLTQSKIASVV